MANDIENLVEKLTEYEENSLLKDSIFNHINGVATDVNIWLIRDYLKHWIKFEGFIFDSKCDREILLRELARCKTSSDIDKLTDNLLNFGIDPF